MVAAVLYSENVWEIVVVTLLAEIITCAMEDIVRKYHQDTYNTHLHSTTKNLLE